MKVSTLRGLALFTGLACALAAQPAAAQVSAPLVHWQLEVLENGETVDTFKADTPLEQTQTQTREHDATHVVGCADKPAAHIVLTRSIAVTPSTSDERGVSFMIDATEMLEDAAAQRTNEGCALPPQPRVVHATHPGLLVGKTGWTDWQVIARDPVLVYRVQASVEPAGAGAAPVAATPAMAAPGPSPATSAPGSAAPPAMVAPAAGTAGSSAPATGAATGGPPAVNVPDDAAPDPGPPDVTVPDDNPSH